MGGEADGERAAGEAESERAVAQRRADALGALLMRAVEAAGDAIFREQRGSGVSLPRTTYIPS